MNKRALVRVLLGSLMIVFGAGMVERAQASCGAVTCFVTIGSQQQVPQEGLLTVNGIYSYTPMTLPSGSSGIIAAAEPTTREIEPNHHRELSTITNSYTLDLNYGLTDRLGVQITLPWLSRHHEHFHYDPATGMDEELHQWSGKGIGDIRVTTKYNVLPTLRSMLVVGLGVELPTGNIHQKDNEGEVLEPSGQLGRGNVGLIPTVYQTYELIPHRLNQFAFASYRHTFKNNYGYQFGDEYILNAGLNLVTVPWLVLTTQLNYRYMVHDSMSASLEGGPVVDQSVPNTGSSWFGIAPGALVNLGDVWQAYFMAQVPLVRDANNNLAQGTTYTFGVTRYFQLPALFKKG